MIRLNNVHEDADIRAVYERLSYCWQLKQFYTPEAVAHLHEVLNAR